MRTLLALVAGCAATAWAADPAPAKDTPPPKPPQAEAEAPRAFLGIAMEEVEDALAYHLRLDNDLGVMVGEITPDSTAAKMGLKTFDVVVACDGKPVYTPRALGGMMRGKKVGDAVELEIRRGAETTKLTGTLQARPPGLDDRGPDRRMPPGMDRFRRFHEMMPPMREDAGPGPRRGRVEKPDGSVMEWSIVDPDAK